MGDTGGAHHTQTSATARADDGERGVGKMHFTRMDQGTDADFQVLARVHEENVRRLPDLLMGMLSDLRADAAYPVDRLTHSLQTATRALRAGADDELVVVALFHDIGESLGPMNHGEVAAAILHPYISEQNHWLLAHHGLFQTYFYGEHLGLDPNARDDFRSSPHYDATVAFCANWDEVSFDPAYPTEPMSTFDPIVRRVLPERWTPPHVGER
jgi:predicted HD phosphohydrolase